MKKRKENYGITYPCNDRCIICCVLSVLFDRGCYPGIDPTSICRMLLLYDRYLHSVLVVFHTARYRKLVGLIVKMDEIVLVDAQKL